MSGVAGRQVIRDASIESAIPTLKQIEHPRPAQQIGRAQIARYFCGPRQSSVNNVHVSHVKIEKLLKENIISY